MNYQTVVYGLSAALFMLVCASQSAFAQMTPGVGYQASLSTISNDVTGTVTILDADTLLVEDFTYDGLGPSVFFYLGTSLSTFEYGLQIGTDLVGTAFDGTEDSFTIDLPAGVTVEGFNAISVWCVPFEASFGDGTFSAPTVKGDVDLSGTVDFFDIQPFIDVLSTPDGFQDEADADCNGVINFFDIQPFIDILAAG